MSKIWKQYLKLKQEDNKTLYLFKAGIFFIFIDKDAQIISQLFHLKLCPFNETIQKCGFPTSQLKKYTTLLENSGYTFKIIDENTTYSLQQYEKNSSLFSFMEEILSIDVNSLSVSETYSLLERIQKEFYDFKNGEI